MPVLSHRGPSQGRLEDYAMMVHGHEIWRTPDSLLSLHPFFLAFLSSFSSYFLSYFFSRHSFSAVFYSYFLMDGYPPFHHFRAYGSRALSEKCESQGQRYLSLLSTSQVGWMYGSRAKVLIFPPLVRVFRGGRPVEYLHSIELIDSHEQLCKATFFIDRLQYE